MSANAVAYAVIGRDMQWSLFQADCGYRWYAGTYRVNAPVFTSIFDACRWVRGAGATVKIFGTMRP